MTDKEQKETVKCQYNEDCSEDLNESNKEKLSQRKYKGNKKTVLDSKILLSSEEKKLLYPKIVEHLDNLWKKNGSSEEYVKNAISQDSKIDEILNDAGIFITEEKQFQTKMRTDIIFLAKYRHRLLYDTLESLKETSPKEFNLMSKKIREVKNEFSNATGKKLSLLHCEIKQEEKELISCKPADDLCLNPIEIELEKEKSRRASQIK